MNFFHIMRYEQILFYNFPDFCFNFMHFWKYTRIESSLKLHSHCTISLNRILKFKWISLIKDSLKFLSVEQKTKNEKIIFQTQKLLQERPKVNIKNT